MSALLPEPLPVSLLQPAPAGLVERTLTRWLLRTTRVASVNRLSANFFLIDVEGDSLQGMHWAPGQKLQVKVGGPLVARTFTPVLLDAARGLTRMLGYAHGEGPGSAWLRRVRTGDECQLLGPRRSLALGAMTVPVILFGDETSFGLAAALLGHATGAKLHCLFEADPLDEARAVLQALAIKPEALVGRGDDAGLAIAVRGLLSTTADGSRWVLTGKAQSIQRVKKILRESGVPASGVMAKAYWSPGKTGLD